MAGNTMSSSHHVAGNSNGDSAGSVYAALSHYGLLLKQDKLVPSVAGIVTGESLSASWWSHSKSHLIFSILSGLSDHPQVTLTKLLAGKDTFVHSDLWPALLSVGDARDEWQLRGLSAAASDLLERVERTTSPVRATGAACKELQVRLLAPAHEIHTAGGHHETVVERWSAWSARMGCTALASGDVARPLLEQATTKLGAPLKWLPWRAALR
jgi:hypothetical protein